MNPLYVIFLDIDGVFTSVRAQYATHYNPGEMWNRLDPIAIDFMNRLFFDYKNVEFVICSTWRQGMNDHPHHRHWVEAAFRSAGFSGVFASEWKTCDTPGPRGQQIAKWLEFNGDGVEDFLVFDDNDDQFEKHLGKKRLIKTDSSDGLLWKHMQIARSMTGNWKKRD